MGHGRATADNPLAYIKHFRQNVLPELHPIDGFLGASLFTADRSGAVAFLVITSGSPGIRCVRLQATTSPKPLLNRKPNARFWTLTRPSNTGKLSKNSRPHRGKMYNPEMSLTPKTWRRIAAKQAALLAAIAGAARTAAAQGCAMCYQNASASGPQGITALRHGVYFLIFPTLAIFIGFFALLYRRRNASREESQPAA